MNNRRKSSGIAAVVALAAAGLVGAGMTTPAVAGKETARPAPTSFGLEASGYASKARGGQIPTGSDKVAYAVVACTNKTGMENANTEAGGDLGNAMTFEGASTRAWTTKTGDTVSAWSRHKIDKITLVGSPLGDVSLTALVDLPRVARLHRSARQSTSSLGSIEFAPTVGEPQEYPGRAQDSRSRSPASPRSASARARTRPLPARLRPTSTRSASNCRTHAPTSGSDTLTRLSARMSRRTSMAARRTRRS